jgi:ribosomal protein L37AE/L43A
MTEQWHDSERDDGQWVYLETPELLKMPPCQHCRNRLMVHVLAQGVYWCGDCMRPFAAVWVRPGVVPPEILADARVSTLR